MGKQQKVAETYRKYSGQGGKVSKIGGKVYKNYQKSIQKVSKKYTKSIKKVSKKYSDFL